MHGQISSAELAGCLPSLHRFALSLTRNGDRATDLVQDCVERALRKAHLFDGSNLRAWLFTVCRRIFLNQIRMEKVRGYSTNIDDAPQSFVSIEQTQETKMHFRDVARAFEQLPRNDQIVLSLVVIEGLKYNEVATLLDVPIGTVRSRLSRARARLQELVERSHGESSPADLGTPQMAAV